MPKCHMKIATALIAAAASLAAAHAAPSAEPAREVLNRTMPPGFKPGFQTTQGGMVMEEWVPADETVDTWTQMITLQTFSGLAVAPNQMLQGWGDRMIGACPGLTHSNIVNGNANAYPTSMLFVSCPDNPQTHKPENIAARVIRGRDRLYMVQFAFRRPLDADDDARMRQFMASAILCDRTAPDHPCPAATR